MATVASPTFAPQPRNDNRGRLLQQLIAQEFKARQRRELVEEERAREAEAAAAAGESFSNLAEQTGIDVDPEVGRAFLTDLIKSGGTAGQGMNILMGISEAKQTKEDEAATQAELAELGRQLSNSKDKQQQFVGDVMQRENLPVGTKIAIMQQTNTLVPEKKRTKLKDVKLYDEQGNERLVRVPETVSDPQKYIESNMPSVAAAGFSTTKRGASDATETQRDVSSIIQTTPELRDNEGMSDSEKRSVARQILRNEDDALRALEDDFKTVKEEGGIREETFGSDPKERIQFELARENIRSVMASGETNIGKVVSTAKETAKQQFDQLEWLPQQLQLTPGSDLDDGAKVVEFLMSPETGVIDEFMLPEEKFNEALDLISGKVNVTDEVRKKLREKVLGAPEPQEEEEEEGSFLDKLLE